MGGVNKLRQAIWKTKHLSLSVTRDEGLTTLFVCGEINEDFSMALIPESFGSKLSLDLSAVEGFNSCGIREWISWIREIRGKCRLSFINCSIPVMDQINMIPQVSGGAEVLSFYAPYFCNCCGEVNKFIVTKEHIKALSCKKAPEFDCDACGSTLVFDSMDASYFLFMDHQNSEPGIG